MSKPRQNWIAKSFQTLCRKEPRCSDGWKIKCKHKRQSLASVSHVVRFVQSMSIFLNKSSPGLYPSWQPSTKYFCGMGCSRFRNRLQAVKREVASKGAAGMSESQFSRLLSPLLLELPEDTVLASKAAASFFMKHRVVKVFKEVVLRAKVSVSSGLRSHYATLALALRADSLVPAGVLSQLRTDEVRGNFVPPPTPQPHPTTSTNRADNSI